jgi:hypothetical protein
MITVPGNLNSTITIATSLYKASLFTVEFKALNNDRWNTHKHLFIADMGIPERLADTNDIQLTTGSVPMDKWKALLEQGDPLIADSGWGEVRDLKVAYSNQH